MKKWQKQKGQTTYNVREVLALAYAAYRTNNYEYIKDTRRFSEPENATIYSNKELVLFTISDTKYYPRCKTFVPVKITAEDLENVEAAFKYFRRYSLSVIANTLENFQQSVWEVIQQETFIGFTGCSCLQLGLLAYVPALIEREQDSNSVIRRIRKEYWESSHISTVGDKIELKGEVLKSAYYKNIEKWSTLVVADASLVSFFYKDEIELGSIINFKCRVKDHSHFREIPNINETRVNYVSVTKMSIKNEN